MLKKSFRVMVLAVILSTVAALLPTGLTFASAAEVTLTTTMRQTEPITNYNTNASEIASLDPQIASDEISIGAIENLFLGLTNTDPLHPGKIVPELASSWTKSADNLTWTFTLRNDVPWVRWDPVKKSADKLRMVTAGDVAYGIKRACDPRNASYYGYVVGSVVAGCQDALNIDSASFTDADLDKIQVKALDDTTLQITLLFPASYFESESAMWVYRPVPQETIEQYGDNWTDVGKIVTNGPYVVDELVRGVRRVYVRNPYIPKDLIGPGNVERIVTTVVADAGTIFSLYQDNQIDVSGVPAAELQSILGDPNYKSQLRQISSPSVFYFGFTFDKPPFDDVHLRRAFSASVDRAAFVQEVLQGRGIPMIHFTPPGMFGAVPINEVGVGYNPDYAKKELAASAYPDCKGLPQVEILTFAASSDWATFLSASVERELGCSANLFTIESQEFSVLLQTIDRKNPPQDRPNMWTLGWGPDYADANNWVNDVLHCESTQNAGNRPCSEIDDLITAAKSEPDSNKRLEMYSQIEDGFFGQDGIFPIIPLTMDLNYVLVKPWYTGPFETDGIFGGAHWDYRSIDQAAQLKARNK